MIRIQALRSGLRISVSGSLLHFNADPDPTFHLNADSDTDSL
jgi:hypothetical protein